MVFPIAGGTQSTGDLISNSLRFNDDDSAYLNRTPSTATNDDKLTFSFWAKRSTPSANHKILTRYSSADNRFYIGFANNDKIYIYQKVGGTESFNLQTDRLFRDPAAWYHIVVAFDTTQGTEANRIKLYVNGVQESSFSTSNYPNQNLDLYYQTATSVVAKIGQYDSSQYYDGYFSDMHLVDGQQLAPTSFGETNDNGVWVPIKYTGTYGDEGFRLEFKETGTSADASGKGADTSGNGNHWDDNGMTAEDITTDTPQNNFATFNPLVIGLTASGNATQPTFSEGNCKTVTANAGKLGGTSTIMISNGKWYAEFEFDATNNSGNTVESLIGVTDSPQLNANSFGKVGERANDVAYEQTGNKMIGDNRTSYGNTYTTGDIIGVAVDLDNNAIYFSKNGTFQNSGNPTSGASKTGAIALTDPASTIEGGYFLGVGEGTTETSTHLANFGNAPFSISSGNSDANGHGNFEYAVPSGYFALCTKNLAEHG